MINFYYLVAGIAYGIFIVQFIISQFVGDMDVDIDADGDADFDVSSLVSFKGLVHFCMGCFGWLSLRQFNEGHVTYTDWFWGFLIGVIFLIVLYFVYKLTIKFNHVPSVNSGEQLIGKEAIVRFTTEESIHVTISNNGESQDLEVFNSEPIEITSGQKVVIKKYIDGKYFI